MPRGYFPVGGELRQRNLSRDGHLSVNGLADTPIASGRSGVIDVSVGEVSR